MGMGFLAQMSLPGGEGRQDYPKGPAKPMTSGNPGPR
jgi:hypothetical protein